jgi:kynureninase
MDIEAWRASFPAVAEEGRVHLNNCSASPLPQRGIDARRECERVWVTEGNPWETWLAKVAEAKARFAGLINADPADVAVLSSATHAFSQVGSALSYDERPGIVVSELEFPTTPQFWGAQERNGAELRVAESHNGVTVPASAYAAHIDDDTALVCTSHAYSFTGGLCPVEAVADAVHDAGGYLFLDAYQSLGVVPIDVDEQGIDMLVSGTLKFLLGGPGIAFLYVDPDVANELEPANLGWFGVEDVFGFEPEDPEYAQGARRFEQGTPPATAAYQASAGMSVIEEVGVDRIRERTQEHTSHLVAGARDRGFAVRSPTDPDSRGSVVNVQVADPAGTADALLENGFNVSHRGGGVRLSPHFYNTAAELDEALDAIDEHGTPG